MGKVKKAVSGGSKPKAPKVQPLAPQVQSDSSYKPTANTGRRAQSILDPMQAVQDEEKEVLG